MANFLLIGTSLPSNAIRGGVVAPTVVGVSSPTLDGALNTGEVILIGVVFSENVTVTGTPQLTLETGAVDRTINFSGGSGSNALLFTYVVQAGDNSPDLDYVSSSALSLNGGTIRDAANNDAVLLLAAPGTAGSLGANKNFVIDTISPTISGVSSSAPNGTYVLGQLIPIQITFSEPVQVTGAPQLLLETGSIDRSATYVSGSGSAVLRFDYTVQAGDNSPDLDYVAVSALNSAIGLIQDPAGNFANTLLPGPGAVGSLGANKNLVIDSGPPSVVNVTALSPDGTYGLGANIDIQVRFSEVVNVSGAPQLVLETGAMDRVASFASGGGSDTLIFSYTVQAGDVNADLDYTSSNALNLNGGSIQDGTTNNAVLLMPSPGATGSLGANRTLMVDGIAPSATTVAIADTLLSGTETSGVTIVFSEAVQGLTGADITVQNGSLSGLASGDGGVTWNAVFTPSPGVSDLTNVLSVDVGGVADLAGNPGSGSVDSGNYAVDTLGMGPASLQVNDASLILGETGTVTITFPEPAGNFGLSDLNVLNGTLSALATLDGGVTWTATLTPNVGVTNSNNVASLDNALVTDANGNPGANTLSSSAPFAIDTLRPTATIQVSDPNLGPGETSPVTLTFSEAVTGFTVSDIVVPNGSLSALSSNDGGITWTAVLTPTSGVNAGNNVLELDLANVTDLPGNPGLGVAQSNIFQLAGIPQSIPTVSPFGLLGIGALLLATAAWALYRIR